MRTVALLLAGVVAAAGCDKKVKGGDERPRVGTGSGSSTAGTAGWAELLGVRTADGSSTIAEVIKGFPGFETCVERMEKALPPDLGADLLPYYDLPDVLCRTREAIAKNDPTACQRVVSYSLKKPCEMMYAMHARKPELCPAEYPARAGRNGYCLAMAQRDPGLCFGAKNEEEEARCRAILARDDKECGNLARVEKRQQCKVEAKRWVSVVTDSIKSSFPPDYRPSFELSLKASNPSRPAPFEKVKLSCADQGVVAPSYGDTAKVVFCDFYPYGYRSTKTASYYSAESRTKVAFEFKPPASDTAKVPFGTDATISIKISGYDEFSGTQTGEISFEKFERRRGGRVKGTLKVTLEQGADRLEVSGVFDAFIRDLVSPTDLRPTGYGYGAGYGGGYGTGGLGSGYGAGTGAGAGAGVLGALGAGRGTGAGIGTIGGKRYAGVLTSATLHAEQQGAKVLGYRVSNIQAGSLWERLGVKERDLVLQVGAVRLQNTGDLIKIRTEVQNAVTLKIRIKRGLRPQWLALSKTAMQKIKDEFYF
jgi:hypothetical protein